MVFTPNAQSYRNYLEQDEEAVRLLRHIPWALIGSEQEHMERVLVGECERFCAATQNLMFSIITPMYNTPPRLLSELIFTCRAQSWLSWELILIDDKSTDSSHLSIADKAAAEDPRIRVIRSPDNAGIGGARNMGMSHAKGHWIGFLDHDDLLHPQALGIFARQIATTPQANFIFSNECKITEDSSKLRDFFYKPDLCVSTLLRTNYIAHLTFIERSFLETQRLGPGQYFSTEFDGVEDHEFFLRVVRSKAIHAVHMTEFCYYWRVIQNSTSHSLSAKPKVGERGLRLIHDTLTQASPHFRIDDLSTYQSRDENRNRFLRCSFSTTRDLDRRIVVIIPFKNAVEKTLACLKGLESQDVVLDVKLIDNNSDQAVSERLLKWTHEKRKHNYLIEPFEGPFNYAKVNNQAFKRHSAGYEFVLFLNNDVILLDSKTIRQMVACFDFDSKIGFCGVKLLFPDRKRVQHGGIKIGLETKGPSYYRPRHMEADSEYVYDDHVVTAVTFACAMTKVSTFTQLGGLEEQWMPNGFGDIDIGLRAMDVGLRNFYLGSITAVHDEGSSRTSNDESLELARLYQRHGGTIAKQLLRQLGYDTFLDLNLSSGWIHKPARYRLVDQLNDFLKRWLSPVHRITRRVLHGAR